MILTGGCAVEPSHLFSSFDSRKSQWRETLTIFDIQRGSQFVQQIDHLLDECVSRTDDQALGNQTVTHNSIVNDTHVQCGVAIGILTVRVRSLGHEQAHRFLLLQHSRKRKCVFTEVTVPFIIRGHTEFRTFSRDIIHPEISADERARSLLPSFTVWTSDPRDRRIFHSTVV